MPEDKENEEVIVEDQDQDVDAEIEAPEADVDDQTDDESASGDDDVVDDSADEDGSSDVSEQDAGDEGDVADTNPPEGEKFLESSTEVTAPAPEIEPEAESVQTPQHVTTETEAAPAAAPIVAPATLEEASSPEEVEGKHKMLKFTISGSYYNAKRDIIDFEDVTGVVPFCNEEEDGVGSMHVRGRFAKKWVKEATDQYGKVLYPERIDKMRQVFIDDVVETTGTLSYFGKSIKDLTIDEMQDLAVAKDLRYIPLPQAGMSKREALVNTYVAYSEKVLRKKIDHQAEDFNYAKLPHIYLDGETRVETEKKLTNDEIINQEISDEKMGGSPKDRFTYEELIQLADSKNITYPVGVDFNDLYSRLFSG